MYKQLVTLLDSDNTVKIGSKTSSIEFNFATIKGQANFATVTAALKNSIAKEVAKTIAA